MKQKEITVQLYNLRKKKINYLLPMCLTCTKCKDTSLGNNRKIYKQCAKCDNCKDIQNCDRYYFTTQAKGSLNFGNNTRIGKLIIKIFLVKLKKKYIIKLQSLKSMLK